MPTEQSPSKSAGHVPQSEHEPHALSRARKSTMPTLPSPSRDPVIREEYARKAREVDKRHCQTRGPSTMLARGAVGRRPEFARVEPSRTGWLPVPSEARDALRAGEGRGLKEDLDWTARHAHPRSGIQRKRIVGGQCNNPITEEGDQEW